MKKYRVSIFNNEPIEEIEVERESEKSIIVNNLIIRLKDSTRKLNKIKILRKPRKIKCLE